MADEKQNKSIDQAALDMLSKAEEEGISTAFSRAETMKPCPIGADGSCCKNCAMGPCRVPAPKNKEETPEEHAKRVGVCGATAETIAARNFVRMIAAGAASHSDHGRRVVEAFKLAAEGKTKDFEIKDEQKLLKVALDLGVLPYEQCCRGLIVVHMTANLCQSSSVVMDTGRLGVIDHAQSAPSRPIRKLDVFES